MDVEWTTKVCHNLPLLVIHYKSINSDLIRWELYFFSSFGCVLILTSADLYFHHLYVAFFGLAL